LLKFSAFDVNLLTHNTIHYRSRRNPPPVTLVEMGPGFFCLSPSTHPLHQRQQPLRLSVSKD
jgi:hypothetical protein